MIVIGSWGHWKCSLGWEPVLNLVTSFAARLSCLVSLVLVIATAGMSGQVQTPSVKGFIANVGQWPSEVLFAYREGNLDTWITRTGIVFDQFEIQRSKGVRDGQVVRLSFMNSKGGSPSGEIRSRSSVNFFVGRNGSSWVTDVPVYSSVRVSDIYRGIDVVYYFDQGRVRYDLDVRSGADLAQMGMKLDGNSDLKIDPETIRIGTSKGQIVMTDLLAYFLQGKKLRTPASFEPRGYGFSIDVPEHTTDKPLLIDPIVYGTYVGGDAYDHTVGVEEVTDGVLVGGTTQGMTFPAGTGGYRSELKSGNDAFVALMTKDLRTVIKYSYYGGSGQERMKALTADAAGNVYFVGETTSSDLPISVGAAGQIYRAQIDGFVVKLDKVLAKLEISTYMGGNKDDWPEAVAVDVSGNVFVAGGTNSSADFPTTLGHQKTLGGQIDGFLCRLSPNGSTYGFSTYFGKEGIETFTALALNTSGEPHVTGTTNSANFETAPTPGRFSSGRLPYDRTFNGGNTDAFVIKFFSDGTLSKRDDGTYSTYFGGNGDDVGKGIFIDQSGRAVVVGTTTSTNLPTLSSYATQPIGRRDVFMAVLADDGRALASCTYYGGTGDDDVLGVDNLNQTATGVIYGTTTSNDFPVFGAGASADRVGTSDGFIAVLNTASLIHSTLVVGSLGDSVNAISLDDKGDIYFSLASQSSDLPTNDVSFSPIRSGGTDGYIGKYAFGVLGIQSPSGGEAWCIGVNNSITWSAEEMLVDEKYRIELSTDAGLTWSMLAKDLAGRSYVWKPASSLSQGSGYRVRVVTERGHVSSSTSFTLNLSPSITTQPSDLSACADAPLELNVVADGTNLKYQWRKNGTNISGATTQTYRIAAVNASSSGRYDVVVSGSCNPATTSRAATVSVASTTAITTQPAGVTVEQTKPFTLSIVAAGTSLSYQWMKDGSPITGATSSEYRVTTSALADGGSYACEVTGGCGKATSSAVSVVVTPSTSVEDDFATGKTWLRLLGPTPASEAAFIRVRQDQQSDAKARIVDEQGRTVATMDLGILAATESDIRIPVNMLSTGVYVVEIQSGAQVGHVRMLIRR